MSQLAPVIVQPANTSKDLPKTSRSGQGQSSVKSQSPFVDLLTSSQKSHTHSTPRQSGISTNDSGQKGQLLSFSNADTKADQQVQALNQLLRDILHTNSELSEMLKEATGTGDLSVWFMNRLMGALELNQTDGAQMISLQTAEETADQQQSDLKGQTEDDLAGFELLSALISQIQGQEQLSSQSPDLKTGSELRQILQDLQFLLSGSKEQAPNAQFSQAAETHRMPATGQGQEQLTSQSFDSKSRSQIQQLLHRIQTLLDQSEGKARTADGQKALHVQESGYKTVQESVQLPQGAAASQQIFPQPAPNRGLAYYLQSYQGAEQNGQEGSVKADQVAAGGDGQTSEGSKDGLFGHGRGSLAEAMFLQNNSSGKGQTSAGSGNQFGMSQHSQSVTESGNGAPANFAGTHVSSAANPSAGQSTTQTFSTQQAFEQSMVDQVRFRLSQGMRSGQQEVVVRMHPRELGEVRLSLTADDGNLRAHLHVQSQQVQDVLERNMPRLREALAEQGIDVDDFMFSSDEQGQHTEYRSFAQDKWTGTRQSESGITIPESSEIHTENEQFNYSPKQGLSVRI